MILRCRGFAGPPETRRKKGQSVNGERLDNDPSGARYGCFLPDLTGLARRLPDDAPVLLAVTEHRLRGGGSFPIPQGTCPVATGTRTDAAVAAYLREGKPVPEPRIFTILPVAHAIASYRTGSGARAFPSEAAALGLSDPEPAPGGWDIYQLTLDPGG